MAILPTIANGGAASAIAQYNLLVEALANIGITDTDQLFAVFTELRLKDANTKLNRSAAELQLIDAITGTKTLSQLAGSYAIPLAVGRSTILAQTTTHSMLMPVRFIRGVSLLGFRLSFGGSGVFQMGLYSNESIMTLLAATAPTGTTPGSDMTALLTAPYEITPDKLYWVCYYIQTWGAWPYAVVESPLISRRANVLDTLGTGLPQTISFADTYLDTDLSYGMYSPTFQLIMDGGMTFA